MNFFFDYEILTAARTRNGPWKNFADNLASSVPRILQGDLGAAPYCGPYVSNHKLGNRVEAVLSGIQSTVLLWERQASKRTSTRVDEGRALVGTCLVNFPPLSI